MWLGIINLPGYEDGIEDLTAGVSLPVLQDSYSADVAESYGAAKWYFTLIDREGKVRYVHYEIDVAGDEEERLLAEIAEIVAGDP